MTRRTYLAARERFDRFLGDVPLDQVAVERLEEYQRQLTYSTDFPTQNAPQASSRGGRDAFVTKLSMTVAAPIGGSGASVTSATMASRTSGPLPPTSSV